MKQIVDVIFCASSKARRGHEHKSCIIPELFWLQANVILSDTLQEVVCIFLFNFVR